MTRRPKRGRPARGPRRAARSERSTPSSSGPLRLLRKPLALAVIGGLAAVAAFARLSPGEEIPPDMIGIWETESTKYADRALGISADSITFYTMRGQFDAHRIKEIESTRENRDLLYSIRFDDRGNEGEFSFFYDPTEGVIRFQNQSQIEWRKARGS